MICLLIGCKDNNDTHFSLCVLFFCLLWRVCDLHRIFILSLDASSISQSEELGEDFTVMDWINVANRRKRYPLRTAQ